MKTRTKTHLKDYQPFPYKIETATLHFRLHPQQTRVKSELTIVAVPTATETTSLELDGEKLKLISIALNDETLSSEQYSITPEKLILHKVPKEFTLSIETGIDPEHNSDLEGLFISGENFCTQCEPHGFRRITYFIDRPDNLTRFKTTIVADKTRYPVLLANGNCVKKGDLDAGLHYAVWDDPFLKPSYLFALVAGKLDVLEDEFTTMSGRNVDLKLYVDPGQLDKAEHAMDSLKKAMRWDEKTYGREYDLDIFMIVAVRDFNMGAMENKGLNIFNSKYILANPDTATDQDYQDILMVVGHEYFHNWSGNRVTCRDWFQLSLKEGFTVFRDQTFTADHSSEAIKRIDDVAIMRTHQFAEDAGPTAHPIQPQSYLEMNNFYTVTVYDKGAEVVRMLRTIVSEIIFRKATDLYFERHDGQAVTVEEFVQAMEDASGLDLSQFRLWYIQAGTPELTITDAYDVDAKHYKLHVKQHIPATPEQDDKQAMHIPLAVGLLDQKGNEIVSTQVLDVKQSEQTFTFDNISEKPIPSLLRGFSAPVKLNYPYTDAQLAILMVHDTDVFTRYEAAHMYAVQKIMKLQTALNEGNKLGSDAGYIAALRQLLQKADDEPALTALLLTLPSEKYILGLAMDNNPVVLHQAREALRLQIATALQSELEKIYAENQIETGYLNNAEHSGKRRLKNCALSYLNLLDNGKLAWQQYQASDNMTDALAALTCLANSDSPHREEALDNFYQKWQADPNVLDKWFMVQATASRVDALETVQKLMQHKAYSAQNPNAIRALVGNFVSANLAQFHVETGEGYQFLADFIINIDKVNKMVAARLATPLLDWRRFDLPRQTLIKKALQKILNSEDISKNTYEVVEKALQS